jgi:hypothetical protein
MALIVFQFCGLVNYVKKPEKDKKDLTKGEFGVKLKR